MRRAFGCFRVVPLVMVMGVLGCRAQTPAAGTGASVLSGMHAGDGAGRTAAGGELSPELKRRVEVLIRSRSNVPPNYTMTIVPAGKADLPGYRTIDVSFVGADGKATKPVTFLLSDDGKTLAQFAKYDISADPKALLSDAGRPARGGPEGAPVVIVGFDDLECPFCARMHAAMFPALQQRYGKSVRFVYKDYPLTEIHPWAMRAAVDVNCVGAQSTDGYWNMVDYVHAHASELGGQEKSLAKAVDSLDELARAEAKRDKLDEAKLNACLQKQDDTAIKRSMEEGKALGIQATPLLYINGEKFEGAYPVEDLYRMIDEALLAQGKTPPPAPAPGPAATKPGN